jgi:pimeloyl-ACP methyl ester carboxylesterase
MPSVRLALALVITAALLNTEGARADEATTRRCEALAGRSISAAAIGLPSSGATIGSASMSDAADPNGEYCAVEGAIHPIDTTAPDIRFQVNLPSQWNGKALHLGGGGYDGSVVTGLAARYLRPGSAQPLKQGYVTFGSDSGHRGAGNDASFAMNDEALENFGGNQLKKTHDAAAWLIERYMGRLPRRTYFEGSSQGGHEAFLVMQRWPDDYDGIVAIHPVYNITALQLSGVRLGQALYNRSGAWLGPDKLALIYDAVMRACDDADGLADGLIGHVSGCRSRFDIDTLRCPAGADGGAACLSAAELGTVRAIGARMQIGFEIEGGLRSFAHWPLTEGGSTTGRFNLGESPTAAVPPTTSDAFAFVMGDQLVRYIALRDPDFDSKQLNPADHAARFQQVSRLVDANSVELAPFRDRGGKLLLLHGTADMAVPPQNSIDYYERLVEHFGAGPLARFVRFYMVPGFGHGDGPFVAGWDWLGAIDAWVEDGVAPANLVAIDTAEPGRGRTRPLCEYPAWPKYRGSGDPNAAASFVCADE